MFAVEILVLARNRRQGEFAFYATPGCFPELPAASRSTQNKTSYRLGKGERIARRHGNTSVAYQKSAVSHVRNHAGNGAGHGFADRIGTTFTPRRRGTGNVEGGGKT